MEFTPQWKPKRWRIAHTISRVQDLEALDTGEVIEVYGDGLLRERRVLMEAIERWLSAHEEKTCAADSELFG
jgi:hypothetical protein